MSNIIIHRIERVVITGEPDPIEKHTFSEWAEAFEYLRGRGLPLTATHEDAIKQHPTTTTNTFMEMVSRGNSAYSAQVFYHIEAEEVQS